MCGSTTRVLVWQMTNKTVFLIIRLRGRDVQNAGKYSNFGTKLNRSRPSSSFFKTLKFDYSSKTSHRWRKLSPLGVMIRETKNRGNRRNKAPDPNLFGSASGLIFRRSANIRTSRQKVNAFRNYHKIWLSLRLDPPSCAPFPAALERKNVLLAQKNNNCVDPNSDEEG